MITELLQMFSATTTPDHKSVCWRVEPYLLLSVERLLDLCNTMQVIAAAEKQVTKPVQQNFVNTPLWSLEA